jgi:hypothetical protein
LESTPTINRAERLGFFLAMPRTSFDEEPPAPRYTYPRVTDEIEAALKRSPRGTQARLSEVLDMDSGTFRNTMKSREGARFSIEQLGVIADRLKAPKGWPWLTWDEAKLYEAFLKLPPSARELLQHMK